MDTYVKHTQGKDNLFLISVKNEDEHVIYLDFTRLAKGALGKDTRQNHNSEKGPNFGFEVHKASEYAEYLRECHITLRNFHRFNTRKGYALFVENV